MFNFQVNVCVDPVVALIVILSGPETKANPLALINTETESERFIVIICQFILHKIRKCWASLWVPSHIVLVVRFAFQESFSVVELLANSTRKETSKYEKQQVNWWAKPKLWTCRILFGGGRFLCYHYRMNNVVKLAQIHNRITIVALISIRSSIHQQQSPRLRFRRKYP